jgi:hypothetical protein
MNQIVNLEMSLKKEIELESQGFRRTRRWIGDAEGVSDPNWYQAKASKIAETRRPLEDNNQVAETEPRMLPIPSVLNRFFKLPYTRRQPVRS